MFVRDFLQAGEYVTLVPIGIPLTLQYGTDGGLEKLILGHELGGKDLTDNLMQTVVRSRAFPLKVTIHAGNTYVRGVLYTDKKYTKEGTVPDACVPVMIEDYLANPESFEFYAGHVESTATVFQGSMFIRKWLTTSGFELLDGFLVPSGVTEASFKEMVSKTYADFPLIASYILYHRDNSVTFPKIPIYQFIVGYTQQIVDESGCVVVDVYSKEYILRKGLPYKEYVKYNLHDGRRVFMLDNIFYSDEPDSYDGENISDTYVCSECGRRVHVDVRRGGPIMCTDDQCNSRLYPRVKQLLKTLDLPELPFARYCKVAKDIGSIFGVLDILDLPEYETCTFELPLNKLVRAIVPKDVLPNDAHVKHLCNECGNSEATLCYYIQNPDKLAQDLQLDEHVYGRFLKWVAEPCNVSDVTSLIYHDRVTIEKSNKAFEGAPIFRNKRIFLTGKFFHGSLKDVRGILASYAATIVGDVENCDCVIIGDLQEDIDGKSVMYARKTAIPTFTESAFFNKYEIDNDLQENLV